jgi:protocatechuate 3,4-dioxygenase beta subunit
MNEMSTKSVPAARSQLWLQVVAGALCGAGLALGLGRYIISDPGIPEPAAPPVNLTRPSLPQSADPYANLTRPSLPEPEPEQPRSSVSGRIYDPANNPVADAWVCSRHGGDIDHCTQSNPDGDYQLDDLPPETNWVSTSAATFEPGKRQIELTPGQLSKHVDIQLHAGGMGLSGVVQDIYGDSITGGRISTSNAATFSDGQGRFKLWLDPDAGRVRAVADGYVETMMQSDASDGPHELFLMPESIIVGKVVDVRTGEPVEGARVSAHADHSVSYGSARTDQAGRFRMDRLTPGDYQLSVTAHRAQGHSAEIIHLGLAETSDEIVVQAHPAAYLTGTVQIADTGRCQGSAGLIVLSSAEVIARIRVPKTVDPQFRKSTASSAGLIHCGAPDNRFKRPSPEADCGTSCR